MTINKYLASLHLSKKRKKCCKIYYLYIISYKIFIINNIRYMI